MKKITINKKTAPTLIASKASDAKADKVVPSLTGAKPAGEISFPLSKGLKRHSEKEKEKEQGGDCVQPVAAHVDVINRHHTGLISKGDMFDLLRGLWGEDVLRGTRSCHENMKSRCSSGYAVLDPAFHKFHDFLFHMGPRPHPQFSIDRIDNSKGYSPENCRWADKPTQTRNRSNTVMLSCDGKTLPLGEWADLQGESARVLHARRAKGLSDYEVVYGERPVIRPSSKYWPPKSLDELEAAVHACCRWPNDERRELRDFISGQMNWIEGQAEHFAVLEEDHERVDAKALEVQRKWTAVYCRYRDLLKAVDRIPNRRFD